MPSNPKIPALSISVWSGATDIPLTLKGEADYIDHMFYVFGSLGPAGELVHKGKSMKIRPPRAQLHGNLFIHCCMNWIDTGSQTAIYPPAQQTSPQTNVSWPVYLTLIILDVHIALPEEGGCCARAIGYDIKTLFTLTLMTFLEVLIFLVAARCLSAVSNRIRRCIPLVDICIKIKVVLTTAAVDPDIRICQLFRKVIDIQLLLCCKWLSL